MKRRTHGLFRILLVAALLAQISCSGLFSGGDNNAGGDNARGDGGRPAPHFKTGFNLFSPDQDIELGKRSAQEIAGQVQLVRDEAVVNYVRQLGVKLSSKAPGYNFPYQFAVVGTREINAFALPGGFVFVNAGTIAAARNEGELAGVIAHEISHVALRHGTNQASKAYVAQRGLDVLGSLAGGDTDLGQAINSIGGTGANMLFLKFGRTAESQADLEGARIMAAAGYDPRDMAKFFETLEKQGGQRAPELLSDHPDPGNRVASINQLLPSLQLNAKPVHDTNEFEAAKARLTGGAAPGALKSAAEPERKGPRDPNNQQPATRPAPPSASLKDFQARDNSYAMRYPANWDALGARGDDTNLIFAPRGAYGQRGDAVFVTHGMFIGVAQPSARDLASANAAFVQQQIENNQDFRVQRQPERINSGGRDWYRTIVAGPSAVSGVIEIDVIYTAPTADGRLFYLITMAPEDEFQTYQGAFEGVIQSLRLAG